jgi:hypothetical protein
MSRLLTRWELGGKETKETKGKKENQLSSALQLQLQSHDPGNSFDA